MSSGPTATGLAAKATSLEAAAGGRITSAPALAGPGAESVLGPAWLPEASASARSQSWSASLLGLHAHLPSSFWCRDSTPMAFTRFLNSSQFILASSEIATRTWELSYQSQRTESWQNLARRRRVSKQVCFKLHLAGTEAASCPTGCATGVPCSVSLTLAPPLETASPSDGVGKYERAALSTAADSSLWKVAVSRSSPHWSRRDTPQSRTIDPSFFPTFPTQPKEIRRIAVNNNFGGFKNAHGHLLIVDGFEYTNHIVDTGYFRRSCTNACTFFHLPTHALMVC